MRSCPCLVSQRQTEVSVLHTCLLLYSWEEILCSFIWCLVLGVWTSIVHLWSCWQWDGNWEICIFCADRKSKLKRFLWPLCEILETILFSRSPLLLEQCLSLTYCFVECEVPFPLFCQSVGLDIHRYNLLWDHIICKLQVIKLCLIGIRPASFLTAHHVRHSTDPANAFLLWCNIWTSFRDSASQVFYKVPCTELE